MERFKPGVASQIRMLREPAKYANFEIRNIIGNGELWSGTGETTRQLFPPLDSLAAADRPNENMCSNGFRLQYGRFRYFTGGDLPGTPDPGFPAWHAPETALAPIVGEVDVHVVNQHGSMGEESEAMLQWLKSTVLDRPELGPQPSRSRCAEAHHEQPTRPDTPIRFRDGSARGRAHRHRPAGHSTGRSARTHCAYE